MNKKNTKYLILNLLVFLVLAVAAPLIKALCFTERGVELDFWHSAALYITAVTAGICIVIRVDAFMRGYRKPSTAGYKYLSCGIWFFLACALCSLLVAVIRADAKFLGYLFIFGTVSAACSLVSNLPLFASAARKIERADFSVCIGAVDILVLSLLPALGFAAGGFGVVTASAALDRNREQDGKLPLVGLILSSAGMIVSCVVFVLVAKKMF